MWEHARYVFDVFAAGTVLASIAGILPPVAALFAIVWYSFLIHDRLRYGPKK